MCIIHGGVIPKVFADPRTAEENGRVWSLLFIVLAVVSATAGFSRTFCFSVSGEALTSRLRSISFKAIMSQVTIYVGRCWGSSDWDKRYIHDTTMGGRTRGHWGNVPP